VNPFSGAACGAEGVVHCWTLLGQHSESGADSQPRSVGFGFGVQVSGEALSHAPRTGVRSFRQDHDEFVFGNSRR